MQRLAEAQASQPTTQGSAPQFRRALGKHACALFQPWLQALTPCAQAKLKAVEEKIATLEAQFAEATAKKEALAKQVRA